MIGRHAAPPPLSPPPAARRQAAVKLPAADGKVFAVAPVRKDGPPAAEKVTDSSRYFVLRIENDKGAYAFIGVGFNQRSGELARAGWGAGGASPFPPHAAHPPRRRRPAARRRL